MSGRLTTIVGVMGSGKTETLINLYKKFINEGYNVKIFKPLKDTRTDKYIVRSRSGATAPATSVQTIMDIHDNEGYLQDIILIDEIQFFDEPDVVDSLLSLCLLGIDVYCFGLDLTSEGKTFGKVGDIMAQSHDVVKLECPCAMCGGPARISHYKGNDKHGDIKVGDLDVYEPLCRDCYHMVKDGFEKHVEDVDNDPLYFFEIGNPEVGFKVELVVKKSTLEGAGYTFDDVKDICTLDGVDNLLKDLGLYEEGDEQ
jgi:thymidine kinase